MTGELPTWAEMTDLDKGAALMHVWKRDREGPAYAVEHYPVQYFDHVALLALDTTEACKHASVVVKNWRSMDVAKFDRLYDLALDASRNKKED
jgi:hypothetical protein